MHTLADGGIGAIGALMEVVVVIILVGLAVTTAVVLTVAWCLRRAGSGPPRPFWLRDRSIPPGLRVLTLFQTVAAIACVLFAFIGSLMPSPWPAWSSYVVVANLAFAVGFGLTANGYVRGGRRLGFVGGCVLGATLLLHAAIRTFIPWPANGMYGIAIVVGAMIPFLLLTRYRVFFCDRVPKCRRCGYDLRATTGDRCTECGRETDHALAA